MRRNDEEQKDLAVTLLYCGVEVKFPEEFGQKGNLLTSGNNIARAEVNCAKACNSAN
jgi:tetratricopeptide repeat protein 7